MIESVHVEAIKMAGPGKGNMVCIGDQKPAFGIGFESLSDLAEKLGYEGVTTIDYDGRADITHDLNYPIPDSLKNTADLLFDGGVLEHVSNIGEGMKSCLAMLKPDGVVVHANPINCYGDSYYGMDPQILHDFYKANGASCVSMCYYYRTGLRAKLMEIAMRWIPARLLEKIRLRLAKTTTVKNAILHDNPADIRRVEVRLGSRVNLPIHTHVCAAYRKILASPVPTVWPNQSMYPKV